MYFFPGFMRFGVSFLFPHAIAMRQRPLTTILAALLAIQLSGASSALFAADQFLETCLQIAKARDKKLAVTEEQLKLAHVRTIRTGRGYFPSVMAQRKYSRGEVRFQDGTKNEYQSEELGVKASQPIYEGGRLSGTYRYDSLTEDASRYNYTKAKEELFARIKLTYYELLAAKMEYTALKKAYDDIDRLMAKVRIEYNAKAIAELDLMEATNLHEKLENLLFASQGALNLATKKLCVLVNVDSLDSIPVLIPEGLLDNVPEISFTRPECLNFVRINNLDTKITQIQNRMAEEKKKVARSKVIPKLYLEGYYGMSGEAYVHEPLTLAQTYSIMGRMAWGFWGNSLELLSTTEKTNPNEIIDASTRTDNNSFEVRLGLLDDMNYFVDMKEAKVGVQQSTAEFTDTLSKAYLELEKDFNDYENSLRALRTLKNEIALKERKLALLRKRNDLYEVPTVQVMEESWRYAETISSYGKALNTNYSSVTEMERLTLMSLR